MHVGLCKSLSEKHLLLAKLCGLITVALWTVAVGDGHSTTSSSTGNDDTTNTSSAVSYTITVPRNLSVTLGEEVTLPCAVSFDDYLDHIVWLRWRNKSNTVLLYSYAPAGKPEAGREFTVGVEGPGVMVTWTEEDRMRYTRQDLDLNITDFQWKDMGPKCCEIEAGYPEHGNQIIKSSCINLILSNSVEPLKPKKDLVDLRKKLVPEDTRKPKEVLKAVPVDSPQSGVSRSSLNEIVLSVVSVILLMGSIGYAVWVHRKQNMDKDTTVKDTTAASRPTQNEETPQQ